MIIGNLFIYSAYMKKLSFTDRVHKVVQAIPKGKTLSYKEVARKAGSPRAYRAVGTIMRTHHNPLTPCHRVIRSDGTVGQYSRPGGTAAKRKILTKEGARV